MMISMLSKLRGGATTSFRSSHTEEIPQHRQEGGVEEGVAAYPPEALMGRDGLTHDGGGACELGTLLDSLLVNTIAYL